MLPPRSGSRSMGRVEAPPSVTLLDEDPLFSSRLGADEARKPSAGRSRCHEPTAVATDVGPLISRREQAPRENPPVGSWVRDLDGTREAMPHRKTRGRRQQRPPWNCEGGGKELLMMLTTPTRARCPK